MKKDSKGRNLYAGESQLSDGRYRYRYTDKNGKRHSVYSWKLTASDKVPQGKKNGLSLRQKEKEIKKDIENGIDTVLSANMTLNDMFDKYIDMKTNLKESTKINYIYLYNLHVKNNIGQRKIKSLKYSDIKTFYNDLVDHGLNVSSVSLIHGILHPTFSLAVKDGIINSNPSDDIIGEMKKSCPKREPRHALTIQEQRLFFEFMGRFEKYSYLSPLFTFFLGTGCRIGEVIGLTWDDIDFQERTISINHNTKYISDGHGSMKWVITSPKTDAGKRTIPLLDEVYKALIDLKKVYLQYGIRCNCEIDGYSDFVFLNSVGNIFLPVSINTAIKKIYKKANKWENERAKAENRQPIEIRHFSAHNLRHTFCTRLCEVENNVKLIMDIMGHSDITTTMNIYNEIQETKRKESFTELNNKLEISAF